MQYHPPMAKRTQTLGNWDEVILKHSGATRISQIRLIQELWSGYGGVYRLTLEGADPEVMIAKVIAPPDHANHPRGWNTNLSHQRKLKSYEVEKAWYRRWNTLCNASCRTPEIYAIETIKGEQLILMEDLDASGFPIRKDQLNQQGVLLCLAWLANFHATFLNQSPKALWPVGTYWHLNTRPDEYKAMENGPLKRHARDIDRRLNQCEFKTFVHGDAKVANFCFSRDMRSVAAVDFQYVGGGCGMKDVAYFLGSCLNEAQLEKTTNEFLNYYFKQLEATLKKKNSDISFPALETEWRKLFPYAWADFHRFLTGWMPGHRKINRFSEQMVKLVTD